MSNVKARHASTAEKKLYDDEEDGQGLSVSVSVSQGVGLGQGDEEEQHYQYWLLCRNFLYALLLCSVLSAVVLAQVMSMKMKAAEGSPLNVAIAQSSGMGVSGGVSDGVSDGGSDGGSAGGSDMRQSVEKMVQAALNKFSFSGTSPPPTLHATAALARPYSSKNRRRSSDIGSGAHIKEGGQCIGQWSSQVLSGRCYGLKPHIDFPELQNVRKVKTSSACQDLCCRLGNTCQTWQYWQQLQVCKLGGVARLFDLGADQDGYDGAWCEKLPPVRWEGRQVVSRDPLGNVQWSEGALEARCFGFYPDNSQSAEGAITLVSVDSNSSNRGEASATKGDEDCQRACEQAKNCAAWQFHPDRGCFFGGESIPFLCEPYHGTFDGGMKVA